MWGRHGTTSRAPGGYDVMEGLGLLAGAANIIMQLSWPTVGYGVYESRVASGRIFDHPYKRSRTTLTYLAVAMRGTDDEKRRFRNAVNTVHARVRSTAASPVPYNAFDPDLQLWVAACLYHGVEDVHRALFGPIPDDLVEDMYRRGCTFGTTLQVAPDRWPADRDAFEEYWNAGLARVRIDEPLREYLLSIARLEFFPKPVSLLSGRPNLFFTTGFLPERFRAEMHLPWSPADQRRFDRLLRAAGAVDERLPLAVREAPFRLLLADMRWRIRTGRALV